MQRFWYISSSGSGAQYPDEGAWCCSIQGRSWYLHAVPWHCPWDWYIHTRAWLFTRTVLSIRYPGTCAFRPCSCVFLRKPFPMLGMCTCLPRLTALWELQSPPLLWTQGWVFYELFEYSLRVQSYKIYLTYALVLKNGSIIFWEGAVNLNPFPVIKYVCIHRGLYVLAISKFFPSEFTDWSIITFLTPYAWRIFSVIQ